ncbi:MAG: hypothetical protein IJX44_04540 [Bacteroidaceae bacterium]|nr:hypothetical protein [Bacteroidaceae bacterium]
MIKECCRSLSYNDEERQFTFPLNPCLSHIWNKVKKDIKSIDPDFHLNDFNQLLTRLCDLHNQYSRIETKCIADIFILPGEVLELSLVDDPNPLRMVKMKKGQYLNVNTGRGYSFGDKYKFRDNYILETSEGYILGSVKSTALLSPSCEHIALSKVYIGDYYRNKISDSLWPIFEMVVNNTNPRCNARIPEYLLMARKMGINSFSLLNILNASTHVWG